MEQLKIEILQPSNMVQKGSALHKLLMNDHAPVLDLLVRESIQNSLDAAALKSDTARPVSVHFRVGSFDNTKLNNSLEGITKEMNDRFPNNKKYQFLSITDTGTQGLTGEMNIEDVTDDNAGNLINLVYDICKPQYNEGAGGSWGIGKTVYFRIGIGLVIYYSRVLNPQTQKCESRLVASLVEDEKSSNALIPRYKGLPKYGIAWWGKKLRENKSLPITDEDYIREFLTIFGIPEFQGPDGIGTTIIVPYINKDMLLKNNAKEWDGQGDGFNPNWRYSLEEYLRIAVQRWYFPRLDNSLNKNVKSLKVKINDSVVNYESFLPIFKIEQALYNRASNILVNDDCLSGYDVKTENIRINSVLKEPLAGWVSYVKINKKDAGMCPPINDYHPNINFNIPIKDPTKNDAVIAYCRKPGMIVSYDQDFWNKNVPSCSSEEFILAVFVLNSKNKLANSEMSLEEYIRKGEHADHSSWNDSSIGGDNPQIVYRIQNHVSKKLSDHFSVEDNKSLRKNSGLGKFLGDMILPPIGFGSLSTNRPHGELTGRSVLKSNVKYKLDRIDYNGDMLSITYKVSAAFDAKSFGLTALISSESTSISFDTWEQELGLNLPFHIVSQNIKINKIGKEKCYNTYIIKTDVESDDLLEAQRVDSVKGSCCGFKAVFREKHAFDALVTVNMVLKKRDVRPIIKPL
jgi:hypothetical protein